MSRIIGDRKKSALDEMEEVARERNRDVAEEERLEALRRKEAERKAKEPKAPSQEPVIVPAENIITPCYNGLEFEPKALSVGPKNVNLNYGVSLLRLKAKGYERHPSPAEAFSLIADNLEGKLKGKLKKVADNLFSSRGEWLSMAFERQGNVLIAYLHPEGLLWNRSTYIRHNFTYSEKKEFDISRIKKSEIVSLQNMGDEFSLYICSRKFNDLPKAMREGVDYVQINIPEDGELWPVKRNLLIIGISRLFIDNVYCGGASRGVREKKIMIDSNTNGGLKPSEP